MLQIHRLLIVIIVGLGLSACATIQEGNIARVSLHSSNGFNKVRATLDGKEIDISKGLVELDKRLPSHSLTVVSDKGQTSTYYFHREVNPEWFGKNLIWIVFPIAYIVDYASASHYQFDPSELNIVLR